MIVSDQVPSLRNLRIVPIDDILTVAVAIIFPFAAQINVKTGAQFD